MRASTEVALRGVVGQNTIDYTMTEGRVVVQEKAKSYLQNLLDTYQTGLLVTEARLLVVDPPREVRDAFHDVVRAWEDRERLMREAEGYREDVVPKARGEAAEMLRACETASDVEVEATPATTGTRPCAALTTTSTMRLRCSRER